MLARLLARVKSITMNNRLPQMCRRTLVNRRTEYIPTLEVPQVLGNLP